MFGINRRTKTVKLYNDKTVSSEGILYEFNNETGIINIDIKLERVKNGGCFEWEDMIVCNQTLGKHFISTDIKSIINIGSGVGTFEAQNAPAYPNVTFYASEMDEKSTQWAKENRMFSNVKYCSDSMTKLLSEEMKYDMAICIDVIEHVKDYKKFLDEFSQLANKAIISTPNRDRSVEAIYKPPYEHHVQEFNAGELFFILKMYYSDVKLYSMPNVLETNIVEVGLYSQYDKLIAVCTK